MELGLRGKTALVTGGSGGIGRAVASVLVREGAGVAFCARSAPALKSAARAFERTAGTARAGVRADLSRLEEVSRAVEAARDRLGTIDILVNNAGAIRGGDFLKTPDEQWLMDWNLKLHGYIRMSRTVFPIMQSQGGGRICNVIGAAARNPIPTYLPGRAANAALINFTKGPADLGAPHGILATAVSPAATRTERWDSLIAQQAAAAGKPVEQYRAEAMAAYPLKRIARPEDIADLVCFLASARASFLTGICITVDGGAARGVYL